MDPSELAAAFDLRRGRLRGIAYRMLGSLAEAEDAVQDAWLRLQRSDPDDDRRSGRLADDSRRATLPQRDP